MFYRHELRVVDSRFFGDLFSFHRNVHLHRWESQLWLPVQEFRSLASLVDDAVLLCLDSMLLAGLSAVGQNRTVYRASAPR
jgi:hypothetical protein